ncbi:DUF1302 domain-containing protein [Bacterioplanoides sp.]|uniref:DUF1302 domain-containing protein n=1 Tax=Bacterioplanoides sp. TaxID=2066072 RepID=UPI003B007558
MAVKAFAKLPLVLAISSAASVQAVEFNFGGVQAQWDNTISYGIGWRLEKPLDEQVHPGNGEAVGVRGEASSYSFDDGTLNYKKGDVYTHVAKWTTELELQYDNYGALFRGRAYYDAAIMDETPEFKDYNSETKENAGRDFELLDAYVWGDFYAGDTPINVRLGRQVISWGESTFIQGGINSINPVDASAFRKPGAEIKEGLLPVEMLYTSIGLTANTSLEAFYQLRWEKTKPDSCGTLFSTADFVADGCGPVVLGGTEDEREILQRYYAELADLQRFDPANPTDRTRIFTPVAQRLEDDEPSDSGQYGVALRWYDDEYTDTEYGFYFMNLHSRLPLIGGVTSNLNQLAFAASGDRTAFQGLVGQAQAAAAAGNAAEAQRLLGEAQTVYQRNLVNPNPVINGNFPSYQIIYPEDQQIMGISFATTAATGASVSGEVSYKPDTPLQWNSLETLVAGAGIPTSRLYQRRLEEVGGDETQIFGQQFEAFDEFDVWQAQVSYIQTIDRIFAADQLAIVAEVGVNYIPDLPSLDDARYGRHGAYGLGDNAGVWTVNDTVPNPAPNFNYCEGPLPTSNGPLPVAPNITPKNCNDEGFTDKWSGGLRLRTTLNYNNAFAGVNVAPRLSVAYDQGNGPEPGSQFIDDRLTTGLAVEFVYRNSMSAEIAYTNYSGGKYNILKNHDTLNLSAKYSF